MVLPIKIPLFPLEGVILFPNLVLPFNIFEDRYLNMINDILKTNHRMFGIIQPNFNEKNQKLSVYETGCLAKIIKFEEFEHNRYLISVKGINRFLINHEKLHVNGYKVGTVSFKNFISDSTNSHNEATFAFKKDKRLKIILKNYFKEKKIKADFDYINNCENKELIDQISILCPFKPEEKQMLLECKFINDRYILLISLLQDNVKKGNSDEIKH